MQEVQVGMGLVVAAVCFVATLAGIGSAVFFAKRNDDNAENIGTILSIVITAPFFCSLIYLLSCIVEKVGKSI